MMEWVGMYREPAPPPPEEAAPAEMVYPAVNRSGNSPGVASTQLASSAFGSVQLRSLRAR